MTKKDKARLAELIAKEDALTDEEKAELAKLQEYAGQEAAEIAPPPDFREGASFVVTMRDSKPTRVYYKDGKEVGAEEAVIEKAGTKDAGK